LVLLRVEIARFTPPQPAFSRLRPCGLRRAAAGCGGLVSVALILTLRWAGVTCYAALRSPDVPPALLRPPSPLRASAGYAGPAIARRTLPEECTLLRAGALRRASPAWPV